MEHKKLRPRSIDPDILHCDPFVLLNRNAGCERPYPSLSEKPITLKTREKNMSLLNNMVEQGDTIWYIIKKTTRHQPRNRLLLSSAPRSIAKPKPSLSIPEEATHHQYRKWRDRIQEKRFSLTFNLSA